MKQQQLLDILAYLWAAFGTYWAAAGMKTKETQTYESPLYRWVRLLILTVVFLMLFSSRTAVGFLARPFLPQMPAFAYLGSIVTFVGLAVAFWARIHLGQYWSDKVVLKIDHQLVRTGPYAYLRHPIYSGVLLGVLGTALVVDRWRALLAFAILFVNYSIKAKREERILAGAFEAFSDYKKRAGFLLPRFRARS